MTLKEVVQTDLGWLNIQDGRPRKVCWGWPRILWCVLRFGTVRAVVAYRWAHALHRKGCRIASKIVSAWATHSTGATVSAGATIGPGFHLPHPLGVIIAPEVRLGAFVQVNQHVTLGGNFGCRKVSGQTFPILGDCCCVCAGAVVAGPARLGSYVVVGANAVVTKDFPDYAVVGGVPAKLLKMQSAEYTWLDGALTRVIEDAAPESVRA